MGKRECAHRGRVPGSALIVQIYHCNLAIVRDYKSAPGKNRPKGTGRFPDRPNQADIRYLPPTGGFSDRALGQLLELFEFVGIPPGGDSPVRINWPYLRDALGLTQEEARALVMKARSLGLLPGLTIAYDHERWLKQSRDKGCLAVMTYVQRSDLSREEGERASAFCDSIDELRLQIISKVRRKGHALRHVFVVPNGHLAPRSTPVPSARAIEVLQTLPPALIKRGYHARLNSYGYTKLIQLAINAHKLGYVARVV